MKRLLFATFLIASMFSFGGELKAHPDSRYEIQNTKLNISDPIRLNNNNSKQYSLRMNLVHIIRDKIASATLTWPYSENFFKDFSSCQSAKRNLKDFLLSQPQKRRKLKFYGSCAPADRSNKSKYEIPEYYKFQLDWVEISRNGIMEDRNPEAYIPFNPAHFATKSSCEENGRRHRMQIKGWDINSVTTYKTKFKSKYICIKTSNL